MFEYLAQYLGAENVIVGDDIAAAYACPSHVARSILACVRPTTVEGVLHVLQWARVRHAPVYTVSTGKNWGYGGGLPVQDGAVLLDLSRLKTIRKIDPVLGLITIEPGVTQGDLYQFLEGGKHPFYTPATGASPDCSVMGNALERGYGVAPVTDHSMAIHHIKSVLADGTIFEGSLSDALLDQAPDSLTKWGVGPYTDGLLSQSNLGIVLEITIKLVRKAESCAMIVLQPSSPEKFTALVSTAQRIKDTHGGVVGSIKFFNQYFSVAMQQPYPSDRVKNPDFNVENWIQEKANEAGCPSWMGILFLHGEKRVVDAALKDCKDALKPFTRKFIAAGPRLLSVIRFILPHLPAGGLFKKIKQQFESLDGLHRLMQGEPQERFLKAAYWRAGDIPQAGEKWNPGRDGCGLIWYAPYMPFQGADIERFEKAARDICLQYHFFPVFSVTSISEKGMTALLPILFDPKTETEQAHACYKALFDMGKEMGYLPYRAHINAMPWFASPDQSKFYQTLHKVKNTHDPESILSPGRYDGMAHLLQEGHK